MLQGLNRGWQHLQRVHALEFLRHLLVRCMVLVFKRLLFIGVDCSIDGAARGERVTEARLNLLVLFLCRRSCVLYAFDGVQFYRLDRLICTKG